jgi:hypothetical protein
LSRLRRQMAFWWTFGATLVLVAVLGSPLVGNRFSTHNNVLLAHLIGGLRFMAWSYRPRSSMMGSIMVWLSPMIATVVMSAMLAGLALLLASARGRFTAFLAGWGVATLAATLISLARVAAIIPITHPGSKLATTLSSAMTSGMWFGVLAGWVTGIVLACTVRGLIPDDEDNEDLDWDDTESVPSATETVPASARPAETRVGVGARTAGTGPRPTVAQPAGGQPRPAQPTAAQPAVAQPAPMQAKPAQPAQKWPPVAPKP